MTSKKDPSYRYHKARNCAVVTIGCKDHYLRRIRPRRELRDVPTTYRRVSRSPSTATHADPGRCDAPLTITELIARYGRFAREYYVKDNKPTSEVNSIKLSLRFVRRLYGEKPASEFSPKRLKAVREAMIAHEITRKMKVTDEATGNVTWTR